MLPNRTTFALYLLAACLAAPAHAQFQPAPGGFTPPPQGGFSQPTAQSPWDRAPGGGTPAPSAAAPSGGPSPFDRPVSQFGEPPCMKDFVPLRDDTDRKAKAVQAASKRKPTPQEACKLFTALVASQDKLQKFAASHVQSCGIPQEVAAQIKAAMVQTDGVRARVCEVAARGPMQTAPSLSDALGTSQLTTPDNTKRGGATFETLSGNALAR